MGYRCPYCNQVCFDNGQVTTSYYLAYDASNLPEILTAKTTEKSAVEIDFSLCPNCGAIAISMSPYWKNKEMKFSFSYPLANSVYIPDYVPSAIRIDYLEAVSIVDLSPKASATLARRCLQGMIHDFWGIREKNLNAEITSLNGKIPATQWKAIDGLRKIGNIGAHMEKDVELIIDVDPGEAKKLIRLIELLIEKWYVARHDEEELFQEITSMADEKESERHLAVTDPNGQ